MKKNCDKGKTEEENGWETVLAGALAVGGAALLGKFKFFKIKLS